MVALKRRKRDYRFRNLLRLQCKKLEFRIHAYEEKRMTFNNPQFNTFFFLVIKIRKLLVIKICLQLKIIVPIRHSVTISIDLNTKQISELLKTFTSNDF